MRPSWILSKWLFQSLAGTFVDGTTLCINVGEVAKGVLDLPIGSTEGVELIGYSIADLQIYPLASKSEIKGAYVIYDNIKTLYGRTKDGNYPNLLRARILCVDKTYSGVEALADAVESKVAGAYIEPLHSECNITSRGSDYDPATGEYLEELLIETEL